MRLAVDKSKAKNGVRFLLFLFVISDAKEFTSRLSTIDKEAS